MRADLEGTAARGPLLHAQALTGRARGAAVTDQGPDRSRVGELSVALADRIPHVTDRVCIVRGAPVGRVAGYVRASRAPAEARGTRRARDRWTITRARCRDRRVRRASDAQAVR